MSKKYKMVDWAVDANVYEVNVRQYTQPGTFAAFAQSLPRLTAMGVKILWFMPIHPISRIKRQGTLGSYYAISDYHEINPEFGTLSDFQSLVKQAHELGMKVIIDWVANHTGCDNVWVEKYPGFYKKNALGENYDMHGWEDVYDLDYSNYALWEEMIAAMRYWIMACDIDGFRCDMAHLVQLEFWDEARSRLDKEKSLFWLAECEEAIYHEVFDATYAWKFLHAMQDVYEQTKGMPALINVLQEYDAAFPPTALRLYFTTNHDENSHSGSEYERLGRSVLAFSVFCALWKNSLPLIYSGQELPNTKRLKFFDKDEIEWGGDLDLEDFFKTLLTLRIAPGSDDANWQFNMLATTAVESIFAFERFSNSDKLIVLLNLSHTPKVKFQLISALETGTYESVFSGIETDIDNRTDFELQPWDYVIYRRL